MRLTILAAALIVGACGGGSDAPSTDAATTDLEAAPVSGTDVVEASDTPAPLLGTLCYRFEDETVTEGLEIEVLESGAVSGYHFGTAHNEEAAYFAAFETELTEGTIGEDDVVTFQTFTEVEGDTQTGEDSWIITADGARLAAFENANELTPFNCEDLLYSIWPPIEE